MSESFKKIIGDVFEAASILLVDKLEGALAEKLQSMSLDEIVEMRESGAAVTRKPGRAAKGKRPKRSTGRLPRRSAEEIAQVVTKVVSLLKKHKGGLRAGDIKSALKLETRELPRVMREAVASGEVHTTGQKRATVYSVGGGREKAVKRAPKRAKKAAKKKPAKKVAKKAKRKPAPVAAAPVATALAGAVRTASDDNE